jgi:Zn ribbon nucleic-acid-binding protein
MDTMDNPVADEGRELGQADDEQAGEDLEGGGGAQAALDQYLEASAASSEEQTKLLNHLLQKLVVANQNTTSETSPLMKAVVNRLAGAPANWHQCMVYFMTTDAEADVQMRALAPAMLVGSYVIVIAQCATVVGIVAGTLFPACENNDFCANGEACNIDTKTCVRCGATQPLRMQRSSTTSETFNWFRDPLFAGYNTTAYAELCDAPAASDGLNSLGTPLLWSKESVVSWCHSCFTFEHGGALAGEVDPMTAPLKAEMEVDSMGTFDWNALVFAASFVSLAVVVELQDIELCTLTMDKATGGDSRVRLATSLLNGMRRWVFLPALTTTIPLLVFMQGADALSVCLNTVAVCFLCDIDTVIYVLLPRRFKLRMEEAGRVMLSNEEADAMSRSRVVHVCAIVCMTLATVAYRFKSTPVTFLMPALAFFIGGVSEGLEASAAQVACHAAKVFAYCLLGLVAWFGMMYYITQ